jgi:hypothetical protein
MIPRNYLGNYFTLQDFLPPLKTCSVLRCLGICVVKVISPPKHLALNTADSRGSLMRGPSISPPFYHPVSFEPRLTRRWVSLRWMQRQVYWG